MGLSKWLDVKWARKIGGAGEFQMKDSRLPCHKITHSQHILAVLNEACLRLTVTFCMINCVYVNTKSNIY